MSLESRVNDRNWVALQMYDSFYPLTEEMSFPEALISLEIISTLHKRRKAYTMFKEKIPRFLQKTLNLDVDLNYGERSGEGHYMMWIHFSDRFVAAHAIERLLFDHHLGHTLMYPNRPTDLFTGWSGETNIVGLLTRGIAGLAQPVKQEGGWSGHFQSFTDAVRLGEADYEAGWFMTDEQAYHLLEACSIYPGTSSGYSFLRTIAERPNTPFEPEGRELVNGYNCGDFAWFALDHAGIVPKNVSEALKIRFSYPSPHYNCPLPLSTLGQKGVDWLVKNGSPSIIPTKVLGELAWRDLFFGYHGLEFFNTKKIAEDIAAHRPCFHAARIWEHANVITWLKTHAHFQSKGVISELYPAVQKGDLITTPYREVKETTANRFILSGHYQRHQEKGNEYRRRKLAKAGLHADAYLQFRKLQESLQHTYHSTVSNEI